jgi:hypothetical protein
MEKEEIVNVIYEELDRYGYEPNDIPSHEPLMNYDIGPVDLIDISAGITAATGVEVLTEDLDDPGLSIDDLATKLYDRQPE